MKGVRTKPFDIVADAVSCILLGAAVCAAVFPHLNLEAGMFTYLLIMAADIGLILLFSYKWWIFPAILAAAAVLTVSYALIFGTADRLFAYAGGFIRWCFSWYPSDSPYADGGLTFIRLVFALPVAGLTNLYFKRLFAFVILPPIALGLLIWQHYEKSALLIPILVLLLSVLLISMARMTANGINKTLPGPDRISGGLLQMFAIAVLPVILLFAFAFSPEKDGDLRSDALVHFVEDIGDLLDGHDDDFSAMRTFDIGKSGFSPLGDRLGGDIVPDSTVVMRVRTTIPVRLTGAVFDTYDGSRWTDAGDMGGYRLTSPLWQGKRREVFGLDKPYGGRPAKDLYYRVASPLTLNISHDMHGNTVFYAGMLQSFKRTDFDAHQIYYNRQGELTTKRVQWSLHYAAETLVFARGTDGFDENMLALEAAASASKDKGFEQLQDYYLQLPETLPNSVYEAAERITEGCTTPYEKALAIERWLYENCVYTLAPGTPPEDRDFVDYFLETRKGYCVYYGSAMTVLARCAGLPARYVTGFALKQDPEINSSLAYVATNATAHAWTEIYFQGMGWVPFDGTGWNFYEPTVIQEELDDFRPERPVSPSSAAEEEDAKKAQKPETSTQESGMSAGLKATAIAILSLVAAFAVFAYVRLSMLLTDARHYYARIRRQHEDLGGRLDACYSRIVRQMAFWGVKQNPDDTMLTFARRVDKQLGGKDMTALSMPVMRMRFGLEEPMEEDVHNACAFSAALERRLKNELGLMPYLWRRIVLGR
ncbi:MAG TPA: transglutaminase domain-containing protein [Feifaniaceae bacterium]|nr:transglutaminase domain-containing protein [Feifaniaceae bacterium]